MKTFELQRLLPSKVDRSIEAKQWGLVTKHGSSKDARLALSWIMNVDNKCARRNSYRIIKIIEEEESNVNDT